MAAPRAGRRGVAGGAAAARRRVRGAVGAAAGTHAANEWDQRMYGVFNEDIETTKALEVGNDTIQFERVWPFGRTQWQRKKTDLNEVERAVWARGRATALFRERR